MTTAKGWLIQRLARTHIAGSALADALDVCTLLARRGMKCTLCSWDPPSAVAGEVAKNYRMTAEAIIRSGMDCILSIKAPAFGYDCDLLRDTLSLARRHNLRLRFDAQFPSSATSTLSLLETMVERYHNIGCTLPARWARSISDAENLARRKVSVRIVKGQWPDPSAPGLDVRKAFLALTDILGGRGASVTVATHDALLASESLKRLRASGTECELEQMFGLPLLTGRGIRLTDVPVRVYVPYGHPYLPYNLSQLRHRPAIAGWVIRDLVLGRKGKITRYRIDPPGEADERSLPGNGNHSSSPWIADSSIPLDHHRGTL